MTQPHRILFEEISKLPLEKVGKALSFVRYLKQEKEPELPLDPAEESELHETLTSGEMVDASQVLSKIMELPDD